MVKQSRWDLSGISYHFSLKQRSEPLLTAFNSILGAGGGLSIRKEARHGKDLLPAVLHGFQGAAGGAARRDLSTAKVILFPLGVRVPQVRGRFRVQAAFEALGRREGRLVPAWRPVPVFWRGEGPESTHAAVIEHADWRAVQIGRSKLVMEMQKGWRKVPVGEPWGHRTLAVVHGGKGVRTIVEWQMHVLLHRDGDAKRTRLLAGNGSIARGFSRGGQDHECRGGQWIGQVGGALHLEGCPVEVHGWTEERACEDVGKRRRWFLLSETGDNVPEPNRGHGGKQTLVF